MKLSALLLIPLLLPSLGSTFAQNAAPSGNTTSLPADSTSSADQKSGLATRTPRYQMRKSDSFELTFALSPEFNQTISVQPDGFITLKAVGTIAAEGLTIPELTQHIEHVYAGVLHDPIITIELKDFDKPYFVASGQLSKPGKYDLRSDLTLTQAVAVAGGFTEASKHSQVVLFRSAANGMTEARLVNVKKMLNSRDLAEDIHLQPGDMIFVPQNRISKISRYLPTSSLGMYGYPSNF